jgi:hypothetical protein
MTANTIVLSFQPSPSMLRDISMYAYFANADVEAVIRWLIRLGIKADASIPGKNIDDLKIMILKNEFEECSNEKT